MGDDSRDADSPFREVAGEVTRVEAVGYLEGASGHAVFSTLFLGVAGVLVARDRWGIGILVIITAYGVALNGLSIYGWDRLRRSLVTRFERDVGPTRTLTPHRISAEMKAELVAGFVMIACLVVGILVASVALRAVDLETAVYLSMAALGIGNVAAVGWTYYAK